MATGGTRNPQYLYADSEWELCRRIRRHVDANGKVDIFIENLSTHGTLIYYTHSRLRATISACAKFKQLGWKLKD